MDIETFEMPIVGDTKESDIPSPQEYQYWKDRDKRVFWIDYEIEEHYLLVELCKTIISMNIEEKDIPEDQLKPITLFIFSYGGELAQGLFLCDLIKSSRIPIITVATGVAMSCGFLIFLAGKKRYLFRHSSLLAHPGSAGFQGNANEVEQAQKNYKRQVESMKKYITENTEIPSATLSKKWNSDWYFTQEEIEKYKIADGFIDDISVLF